MSELETQLEGWVDDRNAGVTPVSTDEVLSRSERRPGPRIGLLAAAAVLVVLAVAAVALLTGDNGTELVVGGDAGGHPLALVPADAEGVVEVDDYDLARRLTGTDRPGRAATNDELHEYSSDLFGLVGADPRAVFSGASADPSVMQTELGVSPADFDMVLRWGMAPDSVTVAVGSFDRQRIDTAVRTDPSWSDRLEADSHRGVDFYRWGEDLALDLDAASELRPGGFAMRLAVIDGTVLVWTRSDAALTRTVDHLLDGGASLADRPLFHHLAEGAGRHELASWTAMGLSAEPERGLVVGRSVVQDEPVSVGLVLFEDGAAAEQATDRVPALLERSDIDLDPAAVTVEHRGRFVVLTSPSDVEGGSFRFHQVMPLIGRELAGQVADPRGGDPQALAPLLLTADDVTAAVGDLPAVPYRGGRDYAVSRGDELGLYDGAVVAVSRSFGIELGWGYGDPPQPAQVQGVSVTVIEFRSVTAASESLALGESLLDNPVRVETTGGFRAYRSRDETSPQFIITSWVGWAQRGRLLYVVRLETVGQDDHTEELAALLAAADERFNEHPDE